MFKYIGDATLHMEYIFNSTPWCTQSFHSSFIHNPLFFFYFDVFEHVSER